MRRLLVFALLIVSACGGSTLGDPPSDWPRPPADAIDARVVHVTDGDTVVLSGIDVGRVHRATGGRSVRLIGVDTPEMRPVECFGREATRFTDRYLAGKRVRAAFDVQPLDRYQRALVYIWTPDGWFFNARLVAEGYATQLTIPPNVEHAELFGRLAAEAREQSRGLWGACEG